MHRTTVQLESGLEMQLRKLANQQRRSLKDVINDLLRRGLEVSRGPKKGSRPLQWHTAAAQPAPGFDPADRTTYLDLLDEGF